jgi:predicted transcriptional regulator
MLSIARGEKDVAEGRVYSYEEALKELDIDENKV